MDYFLLSFEVSWLHLTGAQLGLLLILPFPAAFLKRGPHLRDAGLRAAPELLCVFMHHGFNNKHRHTPSPQIPVSSNPAAG